MKLIAGFLNFANTNKNCTFESNSMENQRLLFHILLYLIGPKTLNCSSFSPVTIVHIGKDKAVRMQAWKDPEGSRRLRLPDFKTVYI